MSNYYPGNENSSYQKYEDRSYGKQYEYPEALRYGDWNKHCPKYPEPPKCYEWPKYPCYEYPKCHEWPKYPCYEYPKCHEWPKYPCYDCHKDHDRKDHDHHEDRKDTREAQRCFVFRFNNVTQTPVTPGTLFQFPIANTIPLIPCRISVPNTTDTNLLARGYYAVTFVASITQPPGAPSSGTVSLRLNGVPVAGGTFDYSLQPNETDQVVINAIVPVSVVPGVLTVATDPGSGVITVLRSSLTVERLRSFDKVKNHNYNYENENDIEDLI